MNDATLIASNSVILDCSKCLKNLAIFGFLNAILKPVANRLLANPASRLFANTAILCMCP